MMLSQQAIDYRDDVVYAVNHNDNNIDRVSIE